MGLGLPDAKELPKSRALLCVNATRGDVHTSTTSSAIGAAHRKQTIESCAPLGAESDITAKPVETRVDDRAAAGGKALDLGLAAPELLHAVKEGRDKGERGARGSRGG